METIEIEDEFYIKANSSFADTRVKILKQGDSFGVFDLYGDLHQLGSGTLGLYHDGTRFLSKLSFSFENKRPLLLSSDTNETNEILSIDLNNPDFNGKDGETISQGKIHMLRIKFLHQKVAYERIRFKNFGLQEMDIDFKMKFDSDFADIFEVRGNSRSKKGKLHRPKTSSGEIILCYEGLDNITRKTRIGFKPEPNVLFENEIHHNLKLQAGETFNLDITISFEVDDQKPKIYSFDSAEQKLDRYNKRVKKETADIYTSNEQFNNWLHRSKADLITMITATDYGPYPYAGVPWFNAPFGRDGIITAYECLWLEPRIAKGALKYLAHTQATEIDDFRDAQPGKILHEKREGEMAMLDEVPFKQYYGTIDATPLFVCLAGAYFERTGDETTIKNIWENIERAITWIDDYGDIDGDGFVEYLKKSSKGLTNQGWKDSFDSIFYEDGTLAKGSIALCEVQGYVYDAKLQASKLASMLGFEDKAEKWKKEADELKNKFNESFWSEKKNTYVLALDGGKNQCDVLTSNAGQCLFTGIATPERAKKVAKNMISDKMFSGWGIRTLSNTEVRYNPMSYHNGSIWPHDNGLIAFGFAKYRLQKSANKVLAAMFDTSIFVDDQRLPELFCGLDRKKGRGPTAYPVACSPQAWAVGSVFLMFQSILGLKIMAKDLLISFNNPLVPEYLGEIIIKNLFIDPENRVDLKIKTVSGKVEVQMLSENSPVKIEVNN